MEDFPSLPRETNADVAASTSNYTNNEVPFLEWQTLSPELIFEILQHFLPAKLSLSQQASFPWYLGHICQSWRAVVISSPQFWNVLAIDLDQDGKFLPVRYIKRALELTKMSLERSTSYPISFRLSMSNPPLCPSQSSKRSMSAMYCHQILEALAAHCARWRDACLVLDVCMLPTLYLAAKNRLPILRSIKLTLSYKMKIQVVADPPVFQGVYSDLFANAPQLTHTSFNDLSLWKINWALVTVLHLTKLPLPHELSRISEASRLETLVITDPANLGHRMPSSGYTTTAITLPFLKILRTPTLDTLLKFKTPRLEELYTRNDLRPVAISRESGMDGYFSSLPDLRKLSICVVGTFDAQRIFRHMPPIIDLSIYAESADVLRLLSTSPRACQFQRLTFGLTSPCEYDGGNLISTIRRWESRAKGIGPFEELTHFTLELRLDQRPSRYHHQLPTLKLLVTEIEDHLRSQHIPWTIRLRDWKNLRVMDIPPFELW